MVARAKAPHLVAGPFTFPNLNWQSAPFKTLAAYAASDFAWPKRDVSQFRGKNTSAHHPPEWGKLPKSIQYVAYRNHQNQRSADASVRVSGVSFKRTGGRRCPRSLSGSS